MNDDELDFLEDAVGSWMEPHQRGDAQHDITAYVVTKGANNGVRSKIDTGLGNSNGRPGKLPPIEGGAAGAQVAPQRTVARSTHKSNKVYGYQEPKPMARPRFRQLDATELERSTQKGGFDLRPSAGIPRYDWRQDKHLKKVRQQRSTVEAKQNVKPSTAGQATRKPFGIPMGALRPKHIAENPKPSSVPSQSRLSRLYEKSGLKLPPIRSGPTAAANQRRTVSQQPAQRKPLQAVTPGPSNRGPNRLPQLSPKKPVGGPAGSPARHGRDPSIEMMDSSREGGVDHWMHQLDKILAENESLLQNLADERAAKSALQRRMGLAAETVDEMHRTMTNTKAAMKRLEGIVKNSSTKVQRRTQLQTKLKSKTTQLSDLRRMHLVMKKRLETAEGKAAASAAALSAPPPDDEADDSTVKPKTAAAQKEDMRNVAKSIESLRKKHTALEHQKKELNEAVRGAMTAAHRHQTAHQQSLAAREADRKKAVTDYKRRIEDELTRELTRLQENHDRATRHRRREHEGRLTAQENTIAEMRQRKEKAGASGGDNNRMVDEAKVTLLSSKKSLNYQQQDLDKAKSSVAELDSRQQQLLEQRAAVNRSIDEVVREREMVDAAPDAKLAPVKAKHDNERRHLQATLTQKQQKQSELLSAVAKIESDVQVAEGKYPAEGASSLADEATQLEAELKTLNTKVDNTNVELAAAKKRHADGKKLLAVDDGKDKAIEQSTRDMVTAERAVEEAEEENTRLLEQLDLAERMVSMNGLS